MKSEILTDLRIRRASEENQKGIREDLEEHQKESEKNQKGIRRESVEH